MVFSCILKSSSSLFWNWGYYYTALCLPGFMSESQKMSKLKSGKILQIEFWTWFTCYETFSVNSSGYRRTLRSQLSAYRSVGPFLSAVFSRPTSQLSVTAWFHMDAVYNVEKFFDHCNLLVHEMNFSIHVLKKREIFEQESSVNERRRRPDVDDDVIL